MRPTGRRGKGLGWLSVAAWAWAAWALVACSDPAGGKEAARAGTPPVASAVPVVVATAVEKPVPTRIQAIGTVQAVSTIQVKAQVSGELLAVHFREGQDVRRGDLLFTIDPRPFQAALDQAQATVARDRAQVRQAEANAARDQAQAQQAEAALGQARAQLLQAEATMIRDAAQLENARVQDTRYAELVKKELIAREQYDQIHTALEAAEAT